MTRPLDLERERRLYRLVHEGLGLAPEARREWLESLELPGRGDREALLERLADIEDDADGLLDRPVLGGSFSLGEEGRADVPPPSVPRFEIQRLLGEGGMGAVYLAQQVEPVERRVALKVMRRAARDEEASARFRFERQALARLRHASIAALYEAGDTEDGRPYFAMEWVDGIPITEFCDGRQLGIGSRLQLFAAVCRGVQHANERQILHRDLKPENVLVRDGEHGPEPKIIDFGIAKTLEPGRPQLTRRGVLGTPEYLPPEALEGSSDALGMRSEVYALGVLLHELLCGRRPYEEDETGLAALLRRIDEGRAEGPAAAFSRLGEEERSEVAERRGTNPRGLDQALRGELDWITRRAIRRVPEERYPSAEELRADIERRLSDEPVRAAPPSAWYRVRKGLKRNRLAVVAAAALIVSLVLGVVGTSLGLLRARDEAAAAREALEQSEVTVRFLNELFTDVDPRRLQGREASARDLLDQGAARIDEEFAEQPLARAELLRTVGDIYVQMGLTEEAEPLLQRALGVYEELDQAEYAPVDLAETLQSLAILAYQRGDWAEATEGYRRALAFGEVLEPERRARMHHNLGIALYRLQRPEQARAEYQEALRIRRRVLADDHPDLANSLGALGVYELFETLDLEKAERYLEESLAIRERAFGADHPYVAASFNNLCLLYRRQGRYDKAELPCRRTVEIRRTVYGDSHGSTAEALAVLVGWYVDQGRADEAYDLALECLAVQERATGTESLPYASRLVVAWTVFWHSGRWQASLDVANELVGIRTRLLAPGTRAIASGLILLGLSQWRIGDLEASAGSMDRAVAMLGDSMDPGERLRWQVWLGRSGLAMDRARAAQGEERSRWLEDSDAWLVRAESAVENLYAEGHWMRVVVDRQRQELNELRP